MTDFKKLTLVLAMVGLLSNGAVQAALHDRGGGLIYDDVLDVTWMADPNYGGFEFTFTQANTWAANLVYHDSVRNVDYDDWRLPTALDPDGSGPCYAGTGCSGSGEFGHLFNSDFGAVDVDFVTPDGEPFHYTALTNQANLALFPGFDAFYGYWTSTVYTQDPENFAWVYLQLFVGKSGNYVSPQENGDSAWVLRDGDIASSVPEQETYAMLLAGLGLLGFMAQRKVMA